MQINLSDIFIEIENFLYQLLFFIVLFPKTVVQSILKPKWIHSYVTDELKKEQAAQFKEYMNPLYFFIVSFFVCTLIAGVIVAEFETLGDSTSTLQAIALSGIPFLLLPIPFALGMLFVNRKPINEAEYKRVYYIQLILLSVGLILFMLIVLVSLPLLQESESSFIASALHTIIILLFSLGASLWFFGAQALAFYKEIQLHQTAAQTKTRVIFKALLATVICLIVDAIIMANFSSIGNLIEASQNVIKF